MLQFNSGKHLGLRAVWVIVTVLLAAGGEHSRAVAKSSPSGESTVRVMKQSPEGASAINLVCGRILRGDFKGAQEILRKSAFPYNKSLRQLGIIVDEYMAIKARRKASQDKEYQTQMEELEKLHQKGSSEDVNDIRKVFSAVLEILEYADKEQREALLNNPLVIGTVQKARAKAAEFEAQGRWLDAYTICYSKLGQIYKDNEAYSDYAEQLLEKADILVSLKDSPCETSKERYAGIEKPMLINAIDVLDSGYVNIIDYRAMAVKAVSHCNLLAEVVSNSNIDMSYDIRSSQYPAWSVALAGILNQLNQSPEHISKDKFIDVFEKVLALNESRHSGVGLPQTLLIGQFAKGALSALDPYTVIHWPSQVQDFEKAITNQFPGIGIRFSKKEGLIKVVSVLPDTPAYNSGLEAGDIIKAVDGVDTRNMSSYCAVKRITGPENTMVTLTVSRPLEHKTQDITINRTKIIVPSVHGWQRIKAGKWRYMIDDRNKIGYVRVTGFNSGTASDFEKALCQLEAKGLKGLVLDLRSSPGGLLNSAIEIADKFVKEGLIVRTQPRFGMATYISANKENTHPNYPVVVLINHLTASASEIVAGVLKDQKYKRATLVGERTYGKGSVQTINGYPGGRAQLKYTAAYYHLPSGQRVENREVIKKLGRKDWGILPDVNVKLRSDELRRIAEVQKANESLIKVSHNNAPDRVTRYSSREMIDTDPQLAIGLLVLKSKMIQFGYRSALN